MPQFVVGELKTATLTMQNPTAKAFDYQAALIVGLPEAARSDSSFSIPAGRQKQVRFPVNMPAVAGTYPVHISVAVDGASIGLYRASEDIQVVAAPVVKFNFGVPVVTLETDFVAPAWKVSVVYCDITNPNSVTVTRKIYCLWSTRYAPGTFYQRYLNTAGATELSLTLNPGQTLRLTSPSHMYVPSTGEWISNSPQYSVQAVADPTTFIYKFADDLGNSSPTAS